MIDLEKDLEITNTVIKTDKVKREYVFAVCADLHNRRGQWALDEMGEIKPDAILIPGDLMHNLDRSYSLKKSKRGLRFLRECKKIAPTFYALGNHEKAVKKINRREIEKTGAKMLLGEVARLGDITVGAVVPSMIEARMTRTAKPKMAGALRLEKEDGFKILLSHHPEHFVPYFEKMDIDLVVSGHAHGGQWRIFGRGVFAPGQGLFPKYTSGLYRGRLYVSRGMVNTVKPIPRINNKCELAIIRVLPKEQGEAF